MAYTSYEDLIDDASQDPKLARARVAEAKKSGTPVVSTSNSGYRDKAISKRLELASGQKPPSTSKKKVKYNSSTIKNKLNNKPEETQSEEIAAKRKKVGY